MKEKGPREEYRGRSCRSGYPITGLASLPCSKREMALTRAYLWVMLISCVPLS